MKKVFIIALGCAVFLGALVSIWAVKLTPKGRKTEVVKTDLFLKQAEESFLAGDFERAKKFYRAAKENTEDVEKLRIIQKRAEEASIKAIFSSQVNQCSTLYTVVPKDVLGKIAKRFNTTVSLIKRANNLDSDVIRPGQRLKVNTCRFSIVVDKSQNLLFLKRKGEIIKTYPVATGKDNSTPPGNFKIINKLINPTWFKTGAVIPPDSPKNILGSRWMGFDIKGYGIHGTNTPGDLGRQITLGCIRMKNSDVEELFSIIPVGTEVVIVN